MESIIITPVICKVIEIIGTISGGLVAAIFLKKLKEKFYDNHGCNSGCIIKFETGGFRVVPIFIFLMSLYISVLSFRVFMYCKI